MTRRFDRFRIEVPESELTDLRDRLARVRWAPEPRGGDEGYGVSRAAVRELVEHWRDRYDWRTWEARINSYPQFTTTVDGTNVHFLHIPSPEPDAVALILSHGWPGSVVEYLDVIGLLSDPRRHGLDPAIAFHLVVPSLPGFGWSGPTPDTGWGPRRIARAWALLMQRLGYDRYGAVGNDWGTYISPELGRVAPEAVVGVHVTQLFSPPAGEVTYLAPTTDPPGVAELSSRVVRLPSRAARVEQPVYGRLGSRDPAHPLSIHWLTGTAGSALRIYAEQERQEPPAGPTTVPLGLASFANDLPSIRAYAERDHADIVSWNADDRGGHYSAHDAPDLLVGDIRDFFMARRC